MMAPDGFRGFHHVWLLGRTTKPGVLCMLPILGHDTAAQRSRQAHGHQWLVCIKCVIVQL